MEFHFCSVTMCTPFMQMTGMSIFVRNLRMLFFFNSTNTYCLYSYVYYFAKIQIEKLPVSKSSELKQGQIDKQ